MIPYDRFRSLSYFGSLDGLRCFAILGVIWQHSPAIPHESMPFTDAGASGVALFFVLSGFLITTLLLREESATGLINLKNFYIRRTLRIFPLYYSVLALYTILVVFLENNAAGRLFISNLPFYLTYTNNWFVDLIINDDGQRRVIFIFAWTLATEEQFYLLWPFLMKYCRRHIAIATLLSVMLVDLVLEFSFGKFELPSTLFERLLRIATSPSTEIFMGVLLAQVLHSRQGFTIIWRVLGKRVNSALPFIVSLAVIMWPGEASLAWYVIQCFTFTWLLAACVIQEGHNFSQLLKFPPLMRIGIVSYGMYLLHVLAVNTSRTLLPHFGIENTVLKFMFALTLTFFAAEISYRCFESPILRLKRRFRADKGGITPKTQLKAVSSIADA